MNLPVIALPIDHPVEPPTDFVDARTYSEPKTSPPRDFELRKHGVYYRDEEKAGTNWLWLCSTTRVIALAINSAIEGWGAYVEIVDPDRHEHRLCLPARLFAGNQNERFDVLFSLGLLCALSSRKTVCVLLSQWQPAARVRTADRPGWADADCESFVLGDCRTLGAKDVIYQSSVSASAAEAMRTVGTLEGWRRTVAIPCIGNPLLLVPVSMAFAGPLLEPLAIDGGGLHLRGASSRGKSTAQRVAVSVWGSPRFMRTWRATSNGLEGVAASCNGTLLALDEMSEVSGREAGAVAYMLANGCGKIRADRSGRARTAARWRVMLPSSGEVALADKVAEDGGTVAAGQSVRLMDIAADRGAYGAFDDLHGARDGAAFSDAMKRATAADCGLAGPAFVSGFLADRDA